MYNKCKAILIASNQKVNSLWSYKGRTLYSNEQSNPNDEDETIYYHFYIISEDEIKEDDFCYHKDAGIFKSKVSVSSENNQVKKIIATTNKDLVTKYDERFKDVVINNNSLNQILPQIPQRFIEQYIIEYNKGNIISDVLVEYEGIEWLDKSLEYFPVTNKNNTINIKTVKDSFSREDMIKFAWWFSNNSGQYSNDESANLEGIYLDKWLQNL